MSPHLQNNSLRLPVPRTNAVRRRTVPINGSIAIRRGISGNRVGVLCLTGLPVHDLDRDFLLLRSAHRDQKRWCQHDEPDENVLHVPPFSADLSVS